MSYFLTFMDSKVSIYIYIYIYIWKVYVCVFVHFLLSVIVYISTHTHTHTHICIYIITLPQQQNATQVQLFKRRLTGLDSEFSFDNGSVTKVLKSRLSYLPIAGRRIFRCIHFPKILPLFMKWKRPGFELGSTCPFPTTTITPRMHPNINTYEKLLAN